MSLPKWRLEALVPSLVLRDESSTSSASPQDERAWGKLDLLFGGVLLIALGGSALGGFTSRTACYAMLAAAAAQAAIAIGFGILGSDPRGGNFSLIFAVFWLLAAALLYGAGRDGR